MAESALRASQADLDGWILLRCVELRREEHPCKHILAVNGLDITHLRFVRGDLVEYPVVLAGDALRLAAVQLDGYELVGEVHRTVAGQKSGDPVLLDDTPRGIEVKPEIVGCQAVDSPSVA